MTSQQKSVHFSGRLKTCSVKPIFHLKFCRTSHDICYLEYWKAIVRVKIVFFVYSVVLQISNNLFRVQVFKGNVRPVSATLYIFTLTQWTVHSSNSTQRPCYLHVTVVTNKDLATYISQLLRTKTLLLTCLRCYTQRLSYLPVSIVMKLAQNTYFSNFHWQVILFMNETDAM